MGQLKLEMTLMASNTPGSVLPSPGQCGADVGGQTGNGKGRAHNVNLRVRPLRPRAWTLEAGWLLSEPLDGEDRCRFLITSEGSCRVAGTERPEEGSAQCNNLCFAQPIAARERG